MKCSRIRAHVHKHTFFAGGTLAESWIHTQRTTAQQPIASPVAISLRCTPALLEQLALRSQEQLTTPGHVADGLLDRLLGYRKRSAAQAAVGGMAVAPLRK